MFLPPPAKSSAAMRAASTEPIPLVSWKMPEMSLSTPIFTTLSEISACALVSVANANARPARPVLAIISPPFLFPDIAAGGALPKPRQDFVPYRTRLPAEFVNADRVAEDFAEIAALDGAVGKIGDIYDAQIHRQPADKGTAPARNHRLDAEASDRGATARQAVGIADGQGGKPACARRRPLAAIADALAGRDLPHLQHTRLQADDAAHRVRRVRRRMAAVKRVAGANQIEERSLVQENAG